MNRNYQKINEKTHFWQAIFYELTRLNSQFIKIARR